MGRLVYTPRGDISIGPETRKELYDDSGSAVRRDGKVELPAFSASHAVWIRGKKVQEHREGRWWSLENDVSGTINREER